MTAKQVAALVVVAFGAGCGSAKTSAWQSFTPETKDFQIHMPSPVKTNVISHGPTPDTWTYEASEGEQVRGTLNQYRVMVVLRGKRPATATEQLDGYRDSERNIYPTGNIVKETKIAIGGFPGRELEIEYWSGKQRAFTRVFLANDKSFHLRVSGDTIKSASQTEVTTFFESFKLNP